MLRVSVVREILNSRISAFAADTSNPSATEPPTTDAFRNPRRVSSMGPPPRGKTGSSYFRAYSLPLAVRCQENYRVPKRCSPPPSGRRSEPPGMRVHVEARPSKKPHERQTGGVGQLDRQAGGGGNGSENGNARGRGLLRDLETGPPGDDQDAVGKREPLSEPGRADQLVHRVVAADVFAHRFEPPGGVEQAGRVKATRLGEDRLLRPEPV